MIYIARVLHTVIDLTLSEQEQQVVNSDFYNKAENQSKRITHRIPPAVLYYLIEPETVPDYCDTVDTGFTVSDNFISYTSSRGNLVMLFNSWDGSQYIATVGGRHGLLSPLEMLGSLLGVVFSTMDQWPVIYRTRAPLANPYAVDVSEQAGSEVVGVNEEWVDEGGIVSSVNYLLGSVDITDIINQVSDVATKSTEAITMLNRALHQRVRLLADIITDDDTIRKVKFSDLDMFKTETRGPINTTFMSLPLRADKVERDTEDGAIRKVYLSTRKNSYIFSQYEDRLEARTSFYNPVLF